MLLIAHLQLDHCMNFSIYSTNCISKKLKKSNEGVPEDSQYASVLVEDGRVRDCNSGEVRSTGVKGEIKTADFVGVDHNMLEARSKSLQIFQDVYKKRVWVTDKGGKAASGKMTNITRKYPTNIKIV